jgi:hypothetical protein
MKADLGKLLRPHAPSKAQANLRSPVHRHPPKGTTTHKAVEHRLREAEQTLAKVEKTRALQKVIDAPRRPPQQPEPVVVPCASILGTGEELTIDGQEIARDEIAKAIKSVHATGGGPLHQRGRTRP